MSESIESKRNLLVAELQGYYGETCPGSGSSMEGRHHRLAADYSTRLGWSRVGF
jgi:hypothetical protein